MVDVLFKSYYVFFNKKIERGVAAAVFVLSVPLSPNISLLLLFAISFFIDIKEFGGVFFGLFIAIIAFSTGMFSRNVYIKKARYKLILPIKHPIIYYTIGVVHYALSIIIFIAAAIALLNASNPN